MAEHGPRAAAIRNCGPWGIVHMFHCQTMPFVWLYLVTITLEETKVKQSTLSRS